MCPCDKGRHPGPQEQKHCQQVEGGDSSLLLTAGERLLQCWVPFCFAWHKRHGHAGVRPTKGQDGDAGSGASETQRVASAIQLQKKRLSGVSSMYINIWCCEVKMMQSGSSQWYPVKWQEATGMKHKNFHLNVIKKKKCLPWEWSNSSTGLPIEAVESPSLRIFNAWLDTTCCNLLKLNLLEKGIKSPGVPFSWICESIFTFLPCFDTIPTMGRYLFLLLIEIDTSFY